MHDEGSDTDTLLALMAGLETQVSSLPPKQPTSSKVEPVPPPVTLAAIPGPVSPVVHEPVPVPQSQVAVQERATLAENFIVQWLVQQIIPWNYQQQALEALHRVRIGGWKLAVLLALALAAGIATGYVAVPQSITTGLRSTYQGFACPVPAQPTTAIPEAATPKQ